MSDLPIRGGCAMNEQINSAAELDALPVGSVVMEGASGEPFEWVVPGVQVMPGVFHRFPDGWYVVSGNGQRDPDPLFGLGFLTVLYRPDQPQRVQPSREDVALTLFELTKNPHASFGGQADAVLALFAQQPTVAEVKAEAWDEGHRHAWRRGPDECMCSAWSSNECACGLYGSGELLSLADNPYREARP